MTPNQYKHLIETFGKENAAIKRMMERVNAGEKIDNLHYKGITNAAALYRNNVDE